MLVHQNTNPLADAGASAAIDETNTAGQVNQTSIETVGAKELRPLMKAIKGKLTDAECQFEKVFYGHLKEYMARKSMQNYGSLILTDVDKIKALMDEFQTSMDELNMTDNDYNDICFYEGFVKGIIKESKDNLPISE